MDTVSMDTVRLSYPTYKFRESLEENDFHFTSKYDDIFVYDVEYMNDDYMFIPKYIVDTSLYKLRRLQTIIFTCGDKMIKPDQTLCCVFLRFVIKMRHELYCQIPLTYLDR